MYYETEKKRERKRRAKSMYRVSASERACARFRDTLTFFLPLLLLLIIIISLYCARILCFNLFTFFFVRTRISIFSNIYARCTHKHIEFRLVFDILYVLCCDRFLLFFIIIIFFSFLQLSIEV